MSVDEAVSLLLAGEVVGLPTETVYGLAADATQKEAVARIFKIKGRPTGHPLILHLASASWLERYCLDVPPIARSLAARFWPGPLTFVLRRNPQTVLDAVTGGLDTVAVRVPGHPVALALLEALDRPVAAPSANKFGGVSPTTKAHVERDLGAAVPLVLEGGACEVGIESTIVDLTRAVPYLLRPGSITLEDLSEVLGAVVAGDDGQGPAAPGTLESHYAPKARVELAAADAAVTRAIELADHSAGAIGLIVPEAPSRELPENILVYVTGASLAQAAHELYSALRQLDEAGCAVIVSVSPPPTGIGLAVADRLKRAAAPRPPEH